MVGFFVVSGIMMLAYAADKGLTGKDKQFFKDAASGGMMEVEMGQMAQEKAQSQEVKDFAKKMVTDHGVANDELGGIAQQKNMKMPGKTERKVKLMMKKMTKLSGADFDKKYMTEMVKDHVKDAAAFKDAAQTVKDPDLKGFAGKTLSTIEQHLKEAKELAKKVGVDVMKAEEEGRKEVEKKMK